MLIGNYCSYIDVHDLCDAVVLAIETDLPGHEVFYIASPDTIGGHPLVETVTNHYGGEGDRVPTARPRGRLCDLDREGTTAARLEADALVARLPRRRRTGARVRTRRLGRLRARSCRPSASAPGRSADRGVSAGAQVDDDESIAAIRRAVELGVNWVDTAAVYGLGHSEEVVGRALAPYRVGEDVFVFTKCGRRWEGRPDGVIENDLRPESIREECERSLRRLGVERIDLYQFHWPDWMTGTRARGLVGDDGRARRGGQGALDRRRELRRRPARALRGDSPRRLGAAAAVAAGPRRAHDRPPVGGRARHRRDRATRRWRPDSSPAAFDRERIAALDASDWRRESPAFQEPALGRNLDLVGATRGRSPTRLGATLPELAVAWVLAQPGVTAAIVGARLPRHVDGWVGASELELDDRHSARSTTRWPRAAQGPTIRRSRRRTSLAAAASANGGRMRLGLLSTADINRKVIPGGSRVGQGRPGRGREPRPGARRGRTRGRGRSSARTARTRRCSRTRTSTPSTSRSRTRCTASGRSARSRRASTSSARSRSARDPADVEAGVRRRRADGLAC